jgi:hypothetical protein
VSPTFIVIILLLLLIVVVGASLIRRRAAAIRAADVMQQLRIQALQATPQDLGLTISENEPFTLVMDIGYPQAIASVVAASTGDASIYFSSGGGVIGGVQHESVRAAAIVLLQEAAKHLEQFVRTSEYPYPSVGQVRFYIATPKGVCFAEVGEQELQEGKSSLSSLYIAGQNVITELRLMTEQQQKSAG